MLRFLTLAALTALFGLGHALLHATAPALAQTPGEQRGIVQAAVPSPAGGVVVRLTEFQDEPAAARLLAGLPAGWNVLAVRQGGQVSLTSAVYCDRAAAESALPAYRQRFPQARIEPAPAAPESPPRPWATTLEQLGFERDAVLQSATPSLAFFFPLPSGLDWTDAALELRLRPAKTDVPFRLTASVEGEPVFSGPVPADGMSHTLRIPLRPGMRRSGSDGLFVELLGGFEQKEGRCAQTWDSGLFLVVENSTALRAAMTRPAKTIAGFFDTANTAYRLTLTGQDPARMEAGLRMASLLGALERKGVERTLDAGPVDPARRTILVTDGAAGTDGASLCGDVLSVTPAGAKMLRPEVLPLLAVRALKAAPPRAEGAAKAAPDKTLVTLEQLGVTRAKSVRGYGNLPVSFGFSLTDLGGTSELTQLTLRYNHSPVTGKEGAFLLVYLNDALVGSRELGRTREPQSFTVNLPAQYMGPVNTVRAVFVAPRCNPAGGDVEFEAAVMPDSALESQTPAEPANLSIGMAGALLRAKGEVALDGEGVGLEAMAALVKSLSLFNGRVLDFELAPSGGSRPAENGADKTAGPSWRLLGLSARELTAFKPILDVSRGFTIVNPLSGQVLVDGETTDGLVVLQAFRDDRNRPCIALTASKPGWEIAPEMLSWEKIRGIGGNLAVLDGNRWVSMKVGEVLEVRYTGDTTLQELWLRYRLFIVLGAGVLFFGILASWWRISAGGKARENNG